MSRVLAASALCIGLMGCGGAYAVRPVSSIAADNVGKPVSRLQEIFGSPRKIDSTATRQIFVWFLPAKLKDGSPGGFHGCELEVSVDPFSQRVLGYSTSNIGWARCSDVQRPTRVASR